MACSREGPTGLVQEAAGGVASERPTMQLTCNMNATTKADVEARIYLLFCLCLFVRIGEHGIVFRSHFPLFRVSEMAVLIFVNKMLS